MLQQQTFQDIEMMVDFMEIRCSRDSGAYKINLTKINTTRTAKFVEIRQQTRASEIPRHRQTTLKNGRCRIVRDTNKKKLESIRREVAST